MDWVEVTAKTVDIAVDAALADLGIESVEHAEVEVLQEPERGFLGIGGKDAIVRVKAKPKRRRRRGRRRTRGSGGGQGDQQKKSQPKQGGKPKAQQGGGRGQGQRSGGNKPRQERSGDRRRKPESSSGKEQKGRRRPEGAMDKNQNKGNDAKPSEAGNGAEGPSPEEQAQVISEFLAGLLDAFGLEGDVETRVDDGVIYADITGEQTEALVGAKGVILQAILELSRTVVQRKTHSGARIRLDIAGYTARRREALKIYAQRLANQVLEDGQEVMLEPMNPADRKVVHDAVAEIEGVRSYSEGEEPHRSVVIGLAPGVEPRGSAGEGDDETQDDVGEAVTAGEEPETTAETDNDDGSDREEDPEPSDDAESSGDPSEDSSEEEDGDESSDDDEQDEEAAEA